VECGPHDGPRKGELWGGIAELSPCLFPCLGRHHSKSAGPTWKPLGSAYSSCSGLEGVAVWVPEDPDLM
jgi:hypothetical protein